MKFKSRKVLDRWQRYRGYIWDKYGFQTKELTPAEKLAKHKEQLNVNCYNRKAKRERELK